MSPLTSGTVLNVSLANYASDKIGKMKSAQRPIPTLPRKDSDVLYVKIGNASERPIHELGDGIQSIIILTYPIFTTKRSWIFIEEPEIFLHPGMQRKILNLFLQNENEHRIFLTTHSNHFLDIALENKGVTILGVRKKTALNVAHDVEQPAIVEILDQADQTALSLLGVRASSVSLVNSTIWVEGITDRYYLRVIFELYLKSLDNKQWLPKEDLHYIFVEYGGSNVVHFAFAEGFEEKPIDVERLCSRALVIVDGDNGSKDSRTTAMRKVLTDRLVELDVREIENILHWDVISKTVAAYENGKINSTTSVQHPDYRNEYLGTFIEKLLGACQTRKGGYATTTGTLKSKRAFCEKALDFLKASTFEELTDDAKEVAKKMYTFIKGQNLS